MVPGIQWIHFLIQSGLSQRPPHACLKTKGQGPGARPHTLSRPLCVSESYTLISCLLCRQSLEEKDWHLQLSLQSLWPFYKLLLYVFWYCVIDGVEVFIVMSSWWIYLLSFAIMKWPSSYLMGLLALKSTVMLNRHSAFFEYCFPWFIFPGLCF